VIEEPDYLRAADIARITGVSVRTARRWIANEAIPSVKIGGARLVPKARLDDLLFPTTRDGELDDDEERRRIQQIISLSGKLSTRTRSIYSMIVFQNVTV
jgi:excisionase family DNA binding protein